MVGPSYALKPEIRLVLIKGSTDNIIGPGIVRLYLLFSSDDERMEGGSDRGALLYEGGRGGLARGLVIPDLEPLTSKSASEEALA